MLQENKAGMQTHTHTPELIKIVLLELLFEENFVEKFIFWKIFYGLH